MKISNSLTLVPNDAAKKKQLINEEIERTNKTFGETLKEATSAVNNLQAEAGQAVEKLVKGEAIDLHEVMIAAEKAKTSFELLMEVRNKAIDAYREIMRMHV